MENLILYEQINDKINVQYKLFTTNSMEAAKTIEDRFFIYLFRTFSIKMKISLSLKQIQI